MKIDISPSPGRVSQDVAATPAAGLANLQALAQQAVAAGLDKPGKSVNGIASGDPESETNRVLIKFTMPMPEIKGDNEDDEVEMPTGLPMSVPMYVDAPASAAPDMAGTVSDTAVEAGDARGATPARVPSTPAAESVRSIDAMVPSIATPQTGHPAERHIPSVDTPAPTDSTRHSVASISPRPRAYSATPSAQGSSSSRRVARGVTLPIPDMPAREGVRPQTRAPLHATAMPAVGHGEQVTGAPKRPAPPAPHEAATRAVGRGEPRAPLGAAVRPQTDTAVQATDHVEPRGPMLGTRKRPLHTAARATTMPVARHAEPHEPIPGAAKRPAHTAPHATTMPVAGHGEQRTTARAGSAPLASTEELATPYRDSAPSLPGSRDTDGPRHRVHAPADAPLLTPWMTSEQAPHRPAEQQPQASRPSDSPAAFGGGASQHPGTDSVTATVEADTAPKDHFEMTYEFSSWGPRAFVALKQDHLRPDAQMVATASDEHVHHILHTALRRPMPEKNGDPSLRLTDLAVESSTERGHKRGRRQR